MKKIMIVALGALLLSLNTKDLRAESEREWLDSLSQGTVSGQIPWEITAEWQRQEALEEMQRGRLAAIFLPHLPSVPTSCWGDYNVSFSAEFLNFLCQDVEHRPRGGLMPVTRIQIMISQRELKEQQFLLVPDPEQAGSYVLVDVADFVAAPQESAAAQLSASIVPVWSVSQGFLDAKSIAEFRKKEEAARQSIEKIEELLKDQ